MKKKITLACIVALAVGVCIGQQVADKKFPWASDDLNKPCGKTELEWRCAISRIDPRPVAIKDRFEVLALDAEPKESGMTVKVAVGLKGGIPEPSMKREQWRDTFDNLSWHKLRPFVMEKLGAIDDHYAGWEMIVFYKNRPVCRSSASGFEMLSE